eukprot:m.398877 g.398877  ORF g.398877 m.398877 type:complete len:71 (-) comp16778_c0_seq44:35-247(-)
MKKMLNALTNLARSPSYGAAVAAVSPTGPSSLESTRASTPLEAAAPGAAGRASAMFPTQSRQQSPQPSSS